MENIQEEITDLEEIEKFNFWVLFYKEDDTGLFAEHIIGLEKEPSTEEVQEYVEEVRTDPEFGLGDKIYDLDVVVLDKKAGMDIAKQMMED